MILEGLLIATGIGVWLLVAILFVVAVAKSGRVSRFLNRPNLLPYNLCVRSRVWGLFLSVLRQIHPPSRKISVELTRALRSAQVADYTKFRDVLWEVNALPTVRKGLEALRLGSIFQVPDREVYRIPTPYTDPLQRPAYYIPGIPARTFYGPEGFDWVKPLEEAFPVIREELLALLNRSGQGFKGYMSESNFRLEGWNTFNFFFYGHKFEDNCALCPKTTALLESLPRFEKDHIMFSALNPHSHIPPHHGPMNGIIRGHLPLVVPQGCYIRAGKDERTWTEGRMLIFDDSFEHEVWNHSDEVRIVLFMNFWHPCLSAEEIAVLTRFRTAYERSPLGRVHEDNQAAERTHDLAMKSVRGAAAAPPPTAPPPEVRAAP